MIRIHLKPIPAILAFLTLWTLAARAATPESPFAREAVLQKADAVTTETYPNADMVWVAKYSHTRYEPDGTAVLWDDEYVKVLTEKGKRSQQVKTFHYTLPYSTVAVHRVEIIKPDRSSVTVDVAQQSRSMVDPSQMSANIYNPNDKLLQVSLPGLEIGDVVHIVSSRRTIKPRVPDTWSDYTIFEYTAPLIQIIYEVSAPEALPLRNRLLRDEVAGTVTYSETQSDGRRLHRWEARDVPRMYGEPRMPALHTVVQRLLVSTIPDWETISRWYWELSKPHLEAVTPAMRETVSERLDGIEDRRGRIEALFQFVSQEVRYMGITPEKEAPGYEPHDVSITFHNRYGVCRDKAALLVSMLRLAGLEAYPVLIHVGPKKDPAVPQPFFNHAVVAVAEADGSYLLMDPTDENTTELLPSYLCNRSFLVAHPEGETLRVSPIDPAEQNMLLVDGAGALDADGTLHMTQTVSFEGINDNAYRGYFAQITPAERRRFFEGLVKRQLPGARLVDLELLPADMQDTSRPLHATLEYEAPDACIRGDRESMLTLPWMGTRIGYVNFVLGETGLAQRKYPLQTQVACGVRDTFRIRLDEAFGDTMVAPDYTPIANSNLTYRQSVVIADHVLEGASTFALTTVEFDPAAYLVLKENLKDIEYNRRKQPVLASVPATAEHDVMILEDATDIALTDARNWTTTQRVEKRILTYAGKKANAELKLTYNPSRETVTLQHASVSNLNGTVHEVVEQELNVMDADWVASAPRYPAEKTLVVSLPGVEIGSVVRYTIRSEMRDFPFFSASRSFGGVEPIQSMRFTVTAPADVPLNVRDPQDAAVAYRADPGVEPAVHTWQASALAPHAKEELLPPAWVLYPTPLLSSGNWNTYARQVRAALLTATHEQPVARETALRAAQGAADARDRIRAVRDYVARNVRAVGPGFGELPLTAVTPADRTLNDGYGNTTDRAIVLYAMLDALELQPEFILASSRLPDLESLYRDLLACPQYAIMDSVLVRVKLDNGMIYLNDTDQYATLGATPHDGKPGLTLNGDPITIEAPPDRKDRQEVSFRIRVSENGDAQITEERQYFGMAHARFRQLYAELPPEETRRHFREILGSLSQAAEPESELVTDYDRYPGVRSFTASVPRFAVRSGQSLYFELPPVLPGILPVRGDRRENPLFLPFVNRFRVTYAVVLPDSVREVNLAPDNLSWQAPAGLGSVAFETDALQRREGEAVLRVMKQLNLRQALIPEIDYPALLEIKRRTEHPASRTILVTVTEE